MRSFQKSSLISFQHTVFLLIVFFLPTQLGKHFWPTFATVSGMRVDYLSPTIYWSDILIIILIMLSILVKEKNIPNKKNTAIIILFGIFLTVSVLCSSQPLAALYGVVKLLEFMCLGFIAVVLLNNTVLVRKTVVVFSAAVLLQSCLAIAQFIHHGSLGGLLYYIGERSFTAETPGIANASIDGALILRPYGTLPHPNVLGGYLVIGIIFILGYLKRSYPSVLVSDLQQRLFLYFTVLVSLITLLLSMSRTAIVVGIVCSIVLLFYKARYRYRILLFLVCGVAFLIVGYTVVAARFLKSSIGESSIQERLTFMQYASTIVRDNLLIGVGMQNYYFALPHYAKSYGTTFLMQPVHDAWLLILVQLGLTGGLFIGYFLLRSYRHIFSLLPGERFAKITLLASYISMSLFDHYFVTIQQGQLLSVFIFAFIWTDFHTPRSEKLAKKA
jgi:hypothetical protein